MKRVLIITYYWPPSGGGGVQRWLKFARYLPDSGWQPVVYAPENADYPVIDPSLDREINPATVVLRHPIWEPYRSVRKLASGGDQGVSAGFIREKKEEGWIMKLIQWIRGNLIIPDARRFWIRTSVRYLVRYLKENPVDVIVSTGPPHSMHLIARRVAARTRIPWLADFRDPWVNMDHADKFRMSPLTKWIHACLEKRVLRNADAVCTVSWYLSGQYELIRRGSVDVITNGFDPSDFVNLTGGANDRFVIGHYGTFGEDRNPHVLWQAIDELYSENKAFRQRLEVQLVGPTDVTVLEEIREKSFGQTLNFIPYLTHESVLSSMKNASILLVILNQNSNEEGRVTGKIFEYLACDNPVLGIGSITSDCARVIGETGAGRMVPFNDKNAMKEFLLSVFNREWKPAGEGSMAMKYSRQQLTVKLAGVLDSLKRR